jgi:phosphatidylglycerophosphatase A
VQKIFLEFFGVGRLPSPALSASLLALLPGIALLWSLGTETLFTLAFATFLVGIFEINKFENRGGTHDDPRIVIDEVTGLWGALSVSGHGLALVPGLPYALPLAFGLSLASYLLFDLWKPSTIGWIRGNVKGGLGVMLDDILAGFAAGMLNLLIFKGIAMVLGSA